VKRGLAIALVGVVGILLGASWQPAQYLSPDSATYVVAARQIAAGEGLTTTGVYYPETEPASLNQFAPGLPVLMALTPGTAREGAALVLVASLAALGMGTVVLFLLLSDGREPWLAALAGLGVVASPASLQSTHRLLSDLPAAAVVVFAAVAMVRLIQAPDRRRAAGVGVALGLMLLMRWSNLYFVVGALGGIALAGLLRDAAVAGVVALMTAGPWLLRNVVATGSVFGERRGASATLGEALGELPQGLLFPFLNDELGVGGIGLAAAVAVAAVGVSSLRGAWSRPDVRALAAAVAVYVVLLTLSRASVHFDPLSGPRFWLAVPPLLLGGLGAFVVGPRRWVAAAALIATVLAFGWGASQQHSELGADRYWAAAKWQRSVKKLLPTVGERPLLTNDRRMLSLHAPGRMAITLPEGPELLAADVPTDAPCVLFFTRATSSSVKRKEDAFRSALVALEKQRGLKRVGRTKRSELWCPEASVNEHRPGSRGPG
jgi:hypothetical protein